MNKVLPFNSNPILKAHQYHAYMAGILTCDAREEVDDWLLSFSLRILSSDNYFCVCYPGDCPILLNELRGTKDDCFDRSAILINDTQLKYDSKNLINKISVMINQGYYAYGMFNEFYIPCKDAYLKYNFIHDYLIIGLDTSISSFYMAGYTSKGLFEIVKLAYDDFYQAVKEIKEDSYPYIDFYKVKKNFSFGFNYCMVKRSLHEFVNSEESSKYCLDYCQYGESALKHFHIKMNKELAEQDPFFYMRNVRSFYEHVVFFAKLIKYLMKHSYIEKTREYDCVLEHFDKAEVVLNLAIKFYVTGNDTIPERIQKMVGDIVKNEIDAARGLYKSI